MIWFQSNWGIGGMNPKAGTWMHPLGLRMENPTVRDAKRDVLSETISSQ
jgi:hypothetical protein